VDAAPLAIGAVVMLDKPQSHYLATVMRQKDGAEIAVFNGRDGEFWGKLHGVGSKYLQITLTHHARAPEAERDVWLLFAPIKLGHGEFLVQKATELGAAALLPVRTERTIVSRINPERLAANIREAAEQSERLSLPSLHAYQSLTEALRHWDAERLLIYGDETHAGQSPMQLLPPLTNSKLAILIGPEGGFTPKELELLRSLPFTRALSLGKRILRADTAALAALTCVMACRGEW
jgi:16S rRNA (uracil1498-N3)-methyltransferase